MNHSRLVLLSGFLGAGKTTILRRMLAKEDPYDTAVVINEAGPGLDHLLIERESDAITLLPNGCMCCRSRGSLSPALARLLRRRAEEGSPPFKRVVVETSGLADPSPILEEIVTDPICNRHFSLAGLVTVVDARAFDASFADHAQVRMQIFLADRLLITKTDLVAGKQIAGLQGRLAEINPEASQFVVPYHAPVCDDLWPDMFDLLRSNERISVTAREALSPTDFAIASLTFGGQLEEEALEEWLEQTTMLFGPSLVRLKAFLDLKGSSVPVVVHGVQGLLHAPAVMKSWPEGGPFNRGVLIGRDIDEELLHDALKRLASQASPYRPLEAGAPTSDIERRADVPAALAFTSE
jgi:G3E family GTPase